MSLARKYQALIDEEWSENGSGDGYWIILKTGYQWDGAHAVHEPTRAAAYRVLREVAPCRCMDCSPVNQ